MLLSTLHPSHPLLFLVHCTLLWGKHSHKLACYCFVSSSGLFSVTFKPSKENMDYIASLPLQERKCKVTLSLSQCAHSNHLSSNKAPVLNTS